MIIQHVAATTVGTALLVCTAVALSWLMFSLAVTWLSERLADVDRDRERNLL